MGAERRADFLAELVYKTTEEGGRRTPARSGYHPQVKFRFSEMQTSGSQRFVDKEFVRPGETVIAELSIVSKDFAKKRLSVGMSFEIREGVRVTALGKILEIFNQDLVE